MMKKSSADSCVSVIYIIIYDILYLFRIELLIIYKTEMQIGFLHLIQILIGP